MKALFIAVVLVVVVSVVADIPVHCLYEQIQGTWRFHLGSNGFDNTVNCSEPFSEMQYTEIKLDYPNVATDESGNVGTWTMIYDQGFEVRIDKQKFFAFSYYATDAGNVTSYCDRTFPGWYHLDDLTHWGCYYGIKVDGAEESVAAHAAAPAPAVADAKRVYKRDIPFVRRINAVATTWHAAEYAEHEGQLLADLQRRSGIVRPPHHRPAAVKPMHAARAAELARVKDALPAAFDWLNVNGVDYVSPVRNQAKCGSCYAFSSAAQLEARLRILSNNTLQPVLSPQDVVSCSEYSQGCEGGFPFLIAGKYAMDFGMVDEACFPYQASDAPPCAARCANPTRYRSSDYFYIGGYYGATTAELMMAEIFQHGPISVSFEVRGATRCASRC